MYTPFALALVPLSFKLSMGHYLQFPTRFQRSSDLELAAFDRLKKGNYLLPATETALQALSCCAESCDFPMSSSPEEYLLY